MFSLKSLLFIVAVAGIGAAGMMHRSQFWASTMVTLTLAVLLLAVCRTWFAPQGRTFWGPFALAGTVYLAIVSLQPLAELHYNLPTTQLVVYGLEKLQAPAQSAAPGATSYVAGTTGYAPPAYYAPSVAVPPTAPPPASSSGAVSTYAYATPVYFQSVYNRPMLFQLATTRFAGEGFAAEARVFLWVAQCLWCLLLAFVMGLVSSWLFRRETRSGSGVG